MPFHSDRPQNPDTSFLTALYASNMWKKGFIWMLAPALVGLIGVSVTLASEYAGRINAMLLREFPLSPLFLMPAGFAFLAYLTRRFFPGTQGSGIPQTIAVIDDPDDKKKNNLLSIRILASKAFMLLFGLSIGASIGREGPTVQIGASVTHAFYGHGGLNKAEHRRMLVLGGGAAGIAAAFNTPLAGIMFAIEELSKKYIFNAHSSTLLTVILSGLISLAIMGNYTYFGSTAATLDWPSHVIAILVCGAVGGAAGGLFSRAMLKISFRPPGILGKLISGHPILFAALCGLGVAILGFLTDGMTFGTGYQPTRATLESGSSIMSWYYGIAKFLATLLSSVSGIAGGLFAPTLSVGAGLGDALSGLLPFLAPHGAIVLLVMAAYLSGVTRSPLTSFIITMEMTDSHHMLLALMTASLVANAVSKLISPVPLYHALSEKFSANGT